MDDVLAQIDQTAAAARAELDQAGDAAALEAFRVKYLGSKGAMKDLMSLLAKVSKEQKRDVGQRVNAVKAEIEAAFEAKKSSASAGGDTRDAIDVTEPGRPPSIGRRHILMQTIDELTDLFGRMGFTIAAGPEVEDEFHNFVALNIPASHPARDPLDNFYLSPLSVSTEGAVPAPSHAPIAPPVQTLREPAKLLRTQTSTVQIRVMENQTPPIRVVIPGRVYRPDTHDETHLSMFHQLEALVVDRGVTMVDLKSTIFQFVRAYIGEGTKIRFRPSFFPFTEPSAEVDVWFEDKQRWIELGGCGMVHPNVLAACNVDPEIYSGWAFGFGIERLAMRKYAINDIRHFVTNDVRFLKQF